MKPLISISKNRAVTAALLSGLGVLLAVGWVTRADEPASPGVVVSGITRPSKERQLKFGGPGIVAEVDVKDGDIIKAHQVLAKQDSRQDEQQLLSDKREADS